MPTVTQFFHAGARCHLIQYPSGRWGFVGCVPQRLAYDGSAEDMATAALCGPGLAAKIAARHGRTFKVLAWDTEAQARAAAAALNVPIEPNG